MPAREQPAFPLSIGADGYLIVHEQETDAEIEDGMAISLLVPQGTRLDPEFGLTDPNFGTGGADLAAIRAAIAYAEPRALTAITEDDKQLQQFVAAVTVAWDRNDQDPQA